MEIEQGYEIVSPSQRNEDKMSAFMEWIQNQGIDASKVQIQRLSDEEYGLFAKNDLEENELIVSVPQKIMLTARPVGGIPTTDIGFRKYSW
jgi:hypothetical protein